MDAPTSVQADLAEKGLDNLIKKSTDPKKMSNFKDWWWSEIAAVVQDPVILVSIIC